MTKAATPIHRLLTRANLAFGQLYQLAYAQVAPDLKIIQTSSNFQAILVEPRLPIEGRLLTDLLPEFVGTEDVLHLVLHGAMPSFQLDLIRRDQTDGSSRYLTFRILPLDEFIPGTGLLFLAEDSTRFGQLGQKLIQRRNETRLMQEALTHAYAELERLAKSDRKSAEDALRVSHLELQDAYDRTMEGWVRALDLRDRETEGHTRRVADVTIRVARAVGIKESEIIHIRRGALLHDMGKLGVPDAILLKNGNLTEAEWATMKKHPTYAYEMLLPISYLLPALDIPYCHHEKWDGSGYPRGLKGEQIPLSARIFALVDVWDALRSNRSYRRGWSEAKVMEHIRANAGTHFDPKAAEVFLRVIDEIDQEQG
jgi:HD-GYP domain-containing protein (c-di-GMP phosphodiesterase class II)